MEAIIAIVVVVVILAIVLIALYNNLVQLRNRVDNAWSQIDVQLQRRLDLIPNLVETVKGYAAHESGTLQKVTEARSAVCNATTPEQKMAADNFLSSTLKSLFAVSEAYPDLKANANFQQLQAEISATEDKISYMRQSYNDTVMKYNSAIQTFPGVLVAGLFKFTARENFDANAAASAAPVVSFGQGNDASQAPSVSMGTAPKDPSDTPSVK
jgi:LemA protein